MLSEAQSPNPDMDCATYIGPIEVRPCAIKSDGRGLFIETRTRRLVEIEVRVIILLW